MRHARKSEFHYQGTLNTKDAREFKRYWEALGHSVQLDKLSSGLYYVYLKLNTAGKART